MNITSQPAYGDYYLKPIHNNHKKYIDIQYSELKLSFQQNRLLLNLDAHIINNFQLPSGALLAKIEIFNQELINLPLYQSKQQIAQNFLYGDPLQSHIYTTYRSINIDLNDPYFTDYNETFINLTLDFDRNKLGQINQKAILPNALNLFFNEIAQIKLSFHYQFQFLQKKRSQQYQDLFIYQTKLIAYYESTNNIQNQSKQQNQSELIEFFIPKYSQITHLPYNLVNIKKNNNQAWKINFFKLEITYQHLDKQSKQTFKINRLYDFNSNFFTLNFILPQQDQKLLPTIIGGYYTVTLTLTYSGFSKLYQFYNTFDFLTFDLKNASNIKLCANENHISLALEKEFYEIKK